MFKLTFDKGTDGERSLLLGQFTERPINGSFVGAASFRVESEDIPDVHGFVDNRKFSTVDAVNGDGVTIPISGGYDTITDFTITYDDARKLYSLSIILGKEVRNAE